MTIGEHMDGFKSMDEIAEKAFALAFFIHGDKVEAISVVREALCKLEVAAAAQVKRLYYAPTRRSLWRRAKPANNRTKVSLSDLHLLQRLIYVESEPYEKERERTPTALGERDLLVHFIKHLIRISIKRNSFYVALGVSRLLHNYSTSETMEIYNVVVQDPDRVKDDYYYRSRKGRLLQEIKERFDSFVSVCRGSRGEERFQTLDTPDEFVELVAECLRQFSPWQTPCSIPRRYDPMADEIPSLSSAHQSEEDKVEINRIHAVIHPDCYELLTNSLKLESPVRRLSVPRFNLPNGKNNMPGPNDKPRRPAPPLSGNEVEALKQILSEQSARRKAAHARFLSVAVNKVERARLDLEISGSTSFAINDGDELVEVRALGGGEPTLLASYLLDEGPGGPFSGAKSEIVLEGGQRLVFKLSSEQGELKGDPQAVLQVSYQETEWLKAAALFRRRMNRRITGSGSFESHLSGAFVKPALAALLLLIFTGALALYLFRSRPEPAPAQLAADNQQPSVKQEEKVVAADNMSGASSNYNKPPETITGPEGAANQNGTERRVARKPARDETARATIIPAQVVKRPPIDRSNARPRQPAPEQTQVASKGTGSTTESASVAEPKSRDDDATRSVQANSGATALSKVRKVFIEVTGGSSLNEQISRSLAESLRDSQRLAPTEIKDEADAAFKIKVTGTTPGEKSLRDSSPERHSCTISVRLVNEDGEVIWPANSQGNGSVYTGTVKDVTSRITRDLMKDVHKSDAQK